VPQLILVGGGHINRELARLVCQGFEYRCIVIDDRSDWVNEENYPTAQRIVETPTNGLRSINWQLESYVVIATRDGDLEALVAVADAPARYIGLVASKRKALKLIASLGERGVDLRRVLARLHCPVGLDLGGRTPLALALSILAELETVRFGRSGGNLRVTEDEFFRLREKRP
jgi:xanthine dehydrogenase accessory factor